MLEETRKPMPLYLAVDAGGTHTTYVLADQVKVLARVQGGSIKLLRVTAETAAQNLSIAREALERESGQWLSLVHRTCVGAAGVTVPAVAGWIETAFRAATGGEVLLTGDVEIALDAAFHGKPGVLILAGTGSNVAARAADGRIVTAGGWGPGAGDEGSGFVIGRECVRFLFRAIDAGRPTMMFDRILEAWQLQDLQELVSRVNGTPAPDFSRLVPVIAACAAEGDAMADEVLTAQGAELGTTALLAIEKLLQLEGREPRPLPTEDFDLSLPDDRQPSLQIAFAGSVLQHVAKVRESVMATVRAVHPACTFLLGTADPVLGALWRARGSQ